MAASRDAPPEGLVSVVITVRNEERHLAALLDSLVAQEGPLEVLVIDSNSEDRTLDIARGYEASHPGVVRATVHGGTRGESRNFGVRQARGELVAFIDGDCVASPQWLRELRQGLARAPVAAGRTEHVGFGPFERLERVELRHGGYDVTLPSCNLAYRRRVFEQLGGFDPWFRTAEDIDLNYRAVGHGHAIVVMPRAVVFARTRDTMGGFLKQALWNGYGRKQLTLKHGKLWQRYSLRRMVAQHHNPWALLRLAAALLGYLLAKIRERPPRATGPQAALSEAPPAGAVPRRP
jgi:glycosyltransferase involved in cell wall biosynthesis